MLVLFWGLRHAPGFKTLATIFISYLSGKKVSDILINKQHAHDTLKSNKRRTCLIAKR